MILNELQISVSFLDVYALGIANHKHYPQHCERNLEVYGKAYFYASECESTRLNNEFGAHPS